MSPPGPGKLLRFRRPIGAVADPIADAMSDEALVAACAIGDAAALAGLFDRHVEAVFRFASRLVAPAPPSDVEDLVQNTFLQVWSASQRFRGGSQVRSWIFGIAANVARHWVRGEARRRGAMAALADCASGTIPPPDEEAAHRELVDRLAEVLPKLSHDQRVAFLLCDVEELPGVEAARALGVRDGTLWRRLHDARKQLRALLTEREP